MAYHFLTPKQFDIVFPLAGTFGHQWACDPIIHTIACEPITLSVELIEALMASVNHDVPVAGPVGITSPTMEGTMVVHASLTGRVSWEVDSDGNAVVRVNRPDVKGVITLHVSAQKVVDVTYVEGQFHLRHALIARDALEALVGMEKAQEALKHLLFSALPDPPQPPQGILPPQALPTKK